MAPRESLRFVVLASSIAGLGFVVMAILNLASDKNVFAVVFALLAVILGGLALLSGWQLRRLR